MPFVVVTNSFGGELCRQDVARPTVIGRDPQCDLCLNDPIVSRRHCLLEPIDGQWCVLDLNSRNGTFVDGQRIARRALRDGCVITIGGLSIVYHAADLVESDSRPPQPLGPFDIFQTIDDSHLPGIRAVPASPRTVAGPSRVLLPGSYDLDEPLKVGRPFLVFDRPHSSNHVNALASRRPRLLRRMLGALTSVLPVVLAAFGL